jgi:hypothetical protein
MRIQVTILAVLLKFSFLGCKTDYRDTTPLIKKNMADTVERANHLIVFIGKKISVSEMQPDRPTTDAGYKARYKVLQNVYGDYRQDIIEFEAYDHYGKPKFAEYENVMLFVEEENGKYYHSKYQYFDVYKTKTGRWAGSYAQEDYNHSFNKGTEVKPEKIEFASEVSYPVKIKSENGAIHEYSYPTPYYQTTGNKAIAIYGNYIEDLFRLKKEGVLMSRGLFFDRNAKEHKKPIELAPGIDK